MSREQDRLRDEVWRDIYDMATELGFDVCPEGSQLTLEPRVFAGDLSLLFGWIYKGDLHVEPVPAGVWSCQPPKSDLSISVIHPSASQARVLLLDAIRQPLVAAVAELDRFSQTLSPVHRRERQLVIREPMSWSAAGSAYDLNLHVELGLLGVAPRVAKSKPAS